MKGTFFVRPFQTYAKNHLRSGEIEQIRGYSRLGFETVVGSGSGSGSGMQELDRLPCGNPQLVQMQVENPPQLEDCLRMLVHVQMIGGNDHLGFHRLPMALA